MILLKRVYEPYSREDGYRILVDRLWPRGVSKVKAHLDLWLKEIGPSDKLRKWFGHDVEKWGQFHEKYIDELKNKKDLIAEIKSLENKHKKITLLFGAKDIQHNQAVVLQQVI